MLNTTLVVIANITLVSKLVNVSRCLPCTWFVLPVLPNSVPVAVRARGLIRLHRSSSAPPEHPMLSSTLRSFATSKIILDLHYQSSRASPIVVHAPSACTFLIVHIILCQLSHLHLVRSSYPFLTSA